MQARVPYIDRVWRVTSSLELDPSLSAQEAFSRLRPLLDTQGTDCTITGDTLTYVKTNPAAQDKLATFTSGTLNVEGEGGSRRLSYDVGSTALFLCFLAPLAFLAFAQLAHFINELEKPALIAEQAEKEKEKAEKAAKGEEEEKLELHWIDQMLGAPEPKQPGEEDEASRDESRTGDARGEREEKDDEPKGKHSPTTAYVFAGIFFAIYLVGRVLEPYLLKRTFRAALNGAEASEPSQFHDENEAVAKLAPTHEGDTKS